MKNLKGKAAAVIVILVIFLFGIFGIPRGGLKASIARNIHLGLDLQGGIHLVLQVHTDEGISDATDRDASALQTALQSDGIASAKVGKLDLSHPEKIVVTGVPLDKSGQARSIITGTNYSGYDVSDGADGSVVMTMKASAITDLRARILTTSIETIRGRVDSLGVSEPTIQQYGLGQDQILVELPGQSDLGHVEHIINSTAKLEIHEVIGTAYPDEAAALASVGGALPPDQEIVKGSASGTGPDEFWVLRRAAIVEGPDFRDAQPGIDQGGLPKVSFYLTTEAGDRFQKYTSEHLRTQMAIVLEDHVREVATIQSAIRDSGEITGGFSAQSAKDLGLMLRSGSLPASITPLETRTVGPSLGLESIHQGVKAAIAGTLAVMLFLLIYYKGAGINAVLALLLNLVILLGFFGLMPMLNLPAPVLTLPGIAGVILTIGMGVDSNVLIFERIREELRAGKAAAAAVKGGFDHAWWTIVDTHVTTIVSALILMVAGTGPVRGFAVTLTFGLLANLFTAVFVSRLIFDIILSNKERGASLSI